MVSGGVASPQSYPTLPELWQQGRGIRNRIVLIYFLCVQFDNIYNQNLKEEIALVKSAWTYS